MFLKQLGLNQQGRSLERWTGGGHRQASKGGRETESRVKQLKQLLV